MLIAAGWIVLFDLRNGPSMSTHELDEVEKSVISFTASPVRTRLRPNSMGITRSDNQTWALIPPRFEDLWADREGSVLTLVRRAA